MRVRNANRVVTPCTKCPHCYLALIQAFLRIYPVKQATIQTIWRRGIRRGSWAVTRAGDLKDDSCDALGAPAFHPDGEFGAVSVEASEDDYCRDGSFFRCSFWQ